MLERDNRLGLIYTILFAVLLAYGLYEKGLFFVPQKTYAATSVVLAGLIGLIVLLFLRKFRAPIWLWFTYGYTGYALLTASWSAAPNLAVGGAVTLVAVSMVMTFVPALNLDWRRLLLAVFGSSAVVLYFFGMAAEFHVIHFVDAIKQHMMGSVFQYKNAFGSYELAAALVLILLGANASKYVWRAPAYFAATISLLGVVASYSRFVWIETPVLLAATILISWQFSRKLHTLLYIGFVLVTAITAAPFTVQALQSGPVTGFLIGTAIAVAASLLVPWLFNRFAFITGRGPRIAVVSGTLAVILCVAASGIADHTAALTSLLHQAHSISFGNTSLQSRLWYYGAALHIWESNPIFGSGFQTWTAKFQAFEQFPYWSDTSHSYLLNQLMDFGLVGTLLWAGVLATTVYSAVKAVRRNPEGRLVHVIALVGAASLFIHALVDIDFDFPVIMIVFFLLLSMGTPYEGGGDHRAQPRNVRPAVAAAGGIVAFIAGVLGMGLSVSQTLVHRVTMTKTRPDQIRLLHTAITLAPYNVDAQVDLAELYFAQFAQSRDQVDAANAMNYAAMAERTGYWDPNLQKTVANIAYQTGNFPEAAEWARRASVDGPLTLQYPRDYMEMAWWIGALTYAKNPTQASQLFHSIVGSYDYLNARIQLIGKDHPDVLTYETWQLHLDAPTQVYAAAAEYALGNYKESLADLRSLSAYDRDANTLTLAEVVSTLDDARLGRNLMNLRPLVSNPTAQQELRIVSAIHE